MSVAQTSLEAFESVKPHIPTCREKVIQFLRNRPKTIGATCEEIAEFLPMRYTTVSARLTELQDLGTITEVVDELGIVYRKTATGRRAVAWTLTYHRY